MLAGSRFHSCGAETEKPLRPERSSKVTSKVTSMVTSNYCYLPAFLPTGLRDKNHAFKIKFSNKFFITFFGCYCDLIYGYFTKHISDLISSKRNC